MYSTLCRNCMPLNKIKSGTQLGIELRHGKEHKPERKEKTDRSIDIVKSNFYPHAKDSGLEKPQELSLGSRHRSVHTGFPAI